MKKNHTQVRGVGVQRGQGFDFYSSGTMVAAGSRSAAGGALGDAYKPSKEMEATTLAGLDALFNHAEVRHHLLMLLSHTLNVFTITG